MKKILLILSTLFLAPKITIGQSNYIKGGIITLKKDTIQGFVDDREWIKSPVKIGFKPVLTQKEQIFQSSEIAGFFVSSSGDNYVSKTIEYEKLTRDITKTSFINMTEYFAREKDIKTQSAFLRVISSGKMSLYQFADDDRELYYFLEQEGKLTSLLYHRFQFTWYGQEIKEYQNQLKAGCLDCKMLSDFDFSRLTHTSTSLGKVVSYYNNCVAPQSISTIRKTKKPWELGLMVGLGYSKIEFNLGDLRYASSLNPQIGVFINYVFPRQRGRFALQNEIHYYNYNSKVESGSGDAQYTGGGYLKPDWTKEVLSVSFIGVKNLFRYTFYQKKTGVYALVGISNGFVIKNNSSSGAVINSFYDIRSHEQSYLVGLGANFGKASLESRLVKGNGVSPFISVSSPTTEIGLFLKYRLN